MITARNYNLTVALHNRYPSRGRDSCVRVCSQPLYPLTVLIRVKQKTLPGSRRRRRRRRQNVCDRADSITSANYFVQFLCNYFAPACQAEILRRTLWVRACEKKRGGRGGRYAKFNEHFRAHINCVYTRLICAGARETKINFVERMSRFLCKTVLNKSV